MNRLDPFVKDGEKVNWPLMDFIGVQNYTGNSCSILATDLLSGSVVKAEKECTYKRDELGSIPGSIYKCY